ncbi:MAG: protein tyrosine phosphatase family protein [Pseudomonadota bacterium]
MTDLPHILNWRRINDRITTSGQPNEDQLAEIRGLGVTHVVNLGPHDNKGALDDETGTVTGLGMTYVYIPVDFEAPSDDDFEDFKVAIEDRAVAKVHVHCIYNARVSAFLYRYSKVSDEISESAAFQNMESIWRPGSSWAAFIDNPKAKGQANRYAGEDY